MALITCSECGKEVSDKASVCPNCGVPLSAIKEAPPISETVSPPVPSSQESVKPKKKRRWVKWAVIILTISALASIFGKKDEQQTKDESPKTTAEQKAEASKTQTSKQGFAFNELELIEDLRRAMLEHDKGSVLKKFTDGEKKAIGWDKPSNLYSFEINNVATMVAVDNDMETITLMRGTDKNFSSLIVLAMIMGARISTLQGNQMKEGDSDLENISNFFIDMAKFPTKDKPMQAFKSFRLMYRCVNNASGLLMFQSK